MIDQMIVATEGTDRDLAAIPVAAAIARQLDVPMTLLSLTERDLDTESRRQALAAKLDQLHLSGTIEVYASASIADRLVEEIRGRNHALACLSTHARSPIGELVLGSIAEHIVRESHAPLLLIGPGMSVHWGSGIETILLCVDTSELSEAVLPYASDLARRTGAELRLVEMLAHERATVTGASDVAGESSYLHQLADRLSQEFGLQPSWDVLHGDDPGSNIAAYAHGLPGALIAMTTHGRSGVAQVIKGSVSHRTLRMAGCPVLLIHPSTA